MDAMPYSGCHGDEGKIDLAPHMENALESVVETIMLYGEYPQRRKVWRNGAFVVLPASKQFDLWSWLARNINSDDRNEFMFAMTVDYNRHSDTLTKWRDKIEKRLIEELAGSEMVREKAEQLAEEARDE